MKREDKFLEYGDLLNPGKIFAEDRAYQSEMDMLFELTVKMSFCLLDKLKEIDTEEARASERFLLSVTPEAFSGENARDVWSNLAQARFEATQNTAKHNRLLNLISASGAGEIEMHILAYLVACRFDIRYKSAVKAVLSAQKDPDLISLFKAFGISTELNRPYFCCGSSARVIASFLPEMDDSEDLMNTQPAGDDRLVALATGQDIFIPDWIRYPDMREVPELLFRDKELSYALNTLNDKERGFLLLYGENGSGKRLLSVHAASRLGKKLTICNISGPIDTRAGMEAACRRFRYAVRESLAENSIIMIRGLKEEDIVTVPSEEHRHDGSGAFRSLLNYMSGRAAGAPGIIVSVDCEEEPSAPGYVDCCAMRTYKPSERFVFWEKALGNMSDDRKQILLQTAGEFELTPGQIAEAAEKYTRKEEDDNKNLSEFRKNIHKACYSVIGHELAKKAKLIDAVFEWDELKLPSKDKKVLRDICNAVQLRSVIMQDWNFKSKFPYGNGITVLFSGPPGTGKTMAAEVLANELQMELYKIDMSQVLDKYVGETEKHIREIFNLAKKGNFILFFDEADAIFNKRLDAKDANERFANIESSMLLQSIEEYDGVAILATNKMSAMDPAFMRRFRFFIQFTEPDEKIAYSIWKSVFPPEAPLDDAVDFKELAHVFTYTGAIIKNVALQAAYMAAGEKSSITLLHILKAVKREMEKNQRVLTKEELGSLSYLYDDLMKER